MMVWKMHAGYEDNWDALGLLPQFLDANDERPAREQFDGNYEHGGGWSPFPGHILNVDRLRLEYPGDPPLRPKGETMLRNERIIVFECDWVVILQPDGKYEVARMD
jgi:hypothetical protein